MMQGCFGNPLAYRHACKCDMQVACAWACELKLNEMKAKQEKKEPIYNYEYMKLSEENKHNDCKYYVEKVSFFQRIIRAIKQVCHGK